MSGPHTILILSDIHYGGEAERQRGNYEANAIQHPGLRLAVKLYCHFIWLRHPFAHNHLVDRFLERTANADLVVANGDYSCDSAFVGVSDDAACQSAAECLGKLRAGLGDRFRATIGDHELGKQALVGGVGGLRLASWHRTVGELGLSPCWRYSHDRWTLLGVTSTLLALDIYEREVGADEWADWQQLRNDHLQQISEAFAELRPDERVILFCHDPTALPYLLELPAVKARLSQIERTIIGHLHTRLVLWPSKLLAGMPCLDRLGVSLRRYTSALNRAKHWQPFKVELCPALAGIELIGEGGYLSLTLDASRPDPSVIQSHRLPRATP